MEGQASMHVSASPDQVYALVSDVTRMGEWSPECYKCEWVDGATGPAVGAKFKGYNRRSFFKWTTTPVVTAADPGKEFAFSTPQTEWRYTFTPADGGTTVTESFVVTSTLTKIYSPLLGGANKLVQGMLATLERVKAAAEASA